MSVYIPTFTKETSPDMYKHIFDEFFYKTCTKGAGYRKWKVYSLSLIMKNPDNANNKRIEVILKSNYISKGCKIKSVMRLQDFNIVPITQVYFKSPIEYFMWMESTQALFKKYMKNSKQYKFEFQNIKNKYPEYFL